MEMKKKNPKYPFKMHMLKTVLSSSLLLETTPSLSEKLLNEEAGGLKSSLSTQCSTSSGSPSPTVFDMTALAPKSIKLMAMV